MSAWAHPRSRGENYRGRTGVRPFTGSSPLTRGKRPRGCRMVYARGLIPAHAGKTTDHWCTSRCSGAHPRSRGENPTLILTIKRGKGSSPLTRGKLRPARARPPVPRLIPAHAGKTSRVVSTDGIKGAHPRSRGENGVVPMLGGVEGGSSPLTRGKRAQGWPDHVRPGLIPAHAGKTV